MKTGDLLIRCIAMREQGQWVAVCLPFDLAAQGETFEEAKRHLNAQITEYVRDALGQDRQHAEYLLNRRAPLRYWLMYALAVVKNKLHLHINSLLGFRTPMPLSPNLASC